MSWSVLLLLWILQKLDVYCPKGLLSTSGKGKDPRERLFPSLLWHEGCLLSGDCKANTKAPSWCSSKNNCSKITKYCRPQTGFKAQCLLDCSLKLLQKSGDVKPAVEQSLGCSGMQCMFSRNEDIYKNPSAAFLRAERASSSWVGALGVMSDGNCRLCLSWKS